MNLASGIGLLIILFGHLAIWCAIYNQLHATAWPRPWRKLIEKIMYVVIATIGYWLVRQYWLTGIPLSFDANEPAAAAGYAWLCCVAAVAVTVRWIYRRWSYRTPGRLIETKNTQCDLRAEFARPPIHGLQARLLHCIPGNQIFKPVIEQKSILLRGLPGESDRLQIVQLSDLHLTGKVGIEFFEKTVELCNQADPDLVVLSGDIVDKAKCLSWLKPILGELRAKLGRFYILGNHDRRVKQTNRLREAIEGTGFVPLSGQWRRVAIPGGCLWLCGNELPWYRGAESMPLHPPSDCDSPRILISHSPDQLRWGLDREIDLMLAGHCHGGQIRLPIIGPIISPSRYGVRFASGAFAFGRMTMLVSRGISADDPIRLNCPPELTVIELRCEAAPGAARR